MFRTPAVDVQSPASQPRPLAIYGAQCWERLRHLLVTNQQRARTPRKLGFALCCHSNATGAPIANLPNNAQLGGSLYHAAKLHPGPCSCVGVRPRTDRQTQTRVTTIHFASSTTHAKCNYSCLCLYWTATLCTTDARYTNVSRLGNLPLYDGTMKPLSSCKFDCHFNHH